MNINNRDYEEQDVVEFPICEEDGVLKEIEVLNKEFE